MTDENAPYSLDYYKSQMVILLTREKELQETQRHLQRVVSTLMALQKISRFLKSTTSLDEGLLYSLRALVTDANYERAVIVLGRGNVPQVHVQGGYSVHEKQVLAGLTQSQLQSFLAELHATGESALLVGPDHTLSKSPMLSLLAFDTCLLAVITDNEGPAGFIAAGYSPAQAEYFAPALELKKDDTLWFDELAHQISSTIANLDLLNNLRAEQARLSSSINSLVMGFMIVDVAHRILFGNKAMNDILGIGQIETMHDLAGRFSNIDLEQIGEEVVAKKAPVEFKEVLYGKNILRLFFAPVIQDATVIGYIFLVEDVTEAKSIERSREEFFSIASHELRTPLTAIRGNASILLQYYTQQLSDPSIKHMLEDTKSAAVRLIKIVNDFLQMSRLEQNRLVFNSQDIDMNAIVKQAVDELRPLAEGKHLTLNYQPFSEMITAFADSDRTKEVALNLISNAINYTHTGSVTVQVLADPDGVKMRVEDTGVGIPQRNQSLLFRKFQQAGDVLARDNTQSTGLGLYISKLMVEAMGGSIELERSEPDKGSTFSFTLPRKAAPDH